VTIERNTLGGIGVASYVQTTILQKHFTDKAIAEMGKDAVRKAMDDLFTRPQSSVTTTRIKTTKTINKQPMFVFRQADDAMLSGECTDGDCEDCCGHYEKDGVKTNDQRCDCLCHYGAVQVGTMLDGEPA
jgi:hypothetical protein